MGVTRSEKEYVFKVKLKGSRRVSRTIALRGDQTLHDLHEAIFAAFDRFDAHLYSLHFRKAPTRRGTAGPKPRARYPQIRERRGASPPQYEAVDE